MFTRLKIRKRFFPQVRMTLISVYILSMSTCKQMCYISAPSSFVSAFVGNVRKRHCHSTHNYLYHYLHPSSTKKVIHPRNQILLRALHEQQQQKKEQEKVTLSEGASASSFHSTFPIYYNDVYEVNLPPNHRFPMAKYRQVVSY